jgi:hypothetical protein
MLLFDRSQPLRDQVERFFPRGFAKAVLMPNQRRCSRSLLFTKSQPNLPFTQVEI